MLNPAQGIEYSISLLNNRIAKTRPASVTANAKNPVIFRIDFGIAKINKPDMRGSNINM